MNINRLEISTYSKRTFFGSTHLVVLGGRTQCSMVFPSFDEDGGVASGTKN